MTNLPLKYNTTTVTDKSILQEICLIRLLLIAMLVLYHSFAPFTGAWDTLPEQEDVATPYSWIGKVSYSFMLEAFTFVSGYIFGYQVAKKGDAALKFKNISLKKFKRLFVPSIVFSIIYMLIFFPQRFNSPIESALQIMNGVGHMWYLPMLFWCFIGVYVLERIKCPPAFALVGLAMIGCFSFIPIPLRIGVSLYYMFFFFGGYVIQRYHIDLLARKYVLMMAVAFSVYTMTFALNNTIIMEYFHTPPHFTDNMLVNKMLSLKLKNMVKLLYASSGVLFVFLLASHLIHKKKLNLSTRTINISTYCFGIYLFQQFILQLLYYHTNLVQILSIHTLPWIAFIFTLFLSFLFTAICLKTKIGRYLIG